MLAMANAKKHIDPITHSPFWASVRIMRPWNVLMVGISMALVRLAWIQPELSQLLDLATHSIENPRRQANVIGEFPHVCGFRLLAKELLDLVMASCQCLRRLPVSLRRSEV